MSDDLTVMGIAATAAAAMGRSRLFSRRPEHPLAVDPDVVTDPKPSARTWRVALALPGDVAIQVGFDRHQQPPRSRASVPDALKAAARLRQDHGGEERAMPQAAQTRRRP